MMRATKPKTRSGAVNVDTVAAAGLLSIGLMLTPSGTAAAQTIGEGGVRVTASSCLTGDSGPRERVATSNGPSFFSNVILYCGDPTKGVLHINAAHPISEDGSDDVNVRDCHNNIMFRGDEIPAAAGNRAWQIARPTGGSATLVFDSESNETITMFTSDSNNWAACAAFPN